MTARYRWLLKAARLVHLTLSMFGLLVLLFFGLTGLILNHPDWLKQDEAQERTETGALPSRLLRRPLDKLLIVEHLRSEYGITAPMTDYEDDHPEQLTVVFKAPGRDSRVVIERKKQDAPEEGDEPPEKKEGDLTVTHRTHNLAGRLADLHRGQ